MTVEIRKAHVKRFSGDTEDSYVDILRLDEIFVSASTEKGGNAGQGKRFVFHWDDVGQEGQEPDREYEDVEVPLTGGGLEGATITVKAIKKMKVSNSGQKQDWYFRNDPDNNTRRKVTYKRVYSAGGVPDATTPVDWKVYKPAWVPNINTSSDGYVDVAFVDSFFQSNSGDGGTFYPNNKELEDLLPASAPSGVWLDPLQMIINVKAGPHDEPKIVTYMRIVTVYSEAGYGGGIFPDTEIIIGQTWSSPEVGVDAPHDANYYGAQIINVLFDYGPFNRDHPFNNPLFYDQFGDFMTAGDFNNLSTDAPSMPAWGVPTGTPGGYSVYFGYLGFDPPQGFGTDWDPEIGSPVDLPGELGTQGGFWTGPPILDGYAYPAPGNFQKYNRFYPDPPPFPQIESVRVTTADNDIQVNFAQLAVPFSGATFNGEHYTTIGYHVSRASPYNQLVLTILMKKDGTE